MMLVPVCLCLFVSGFDSLDLPLWNHGSKSVNSHVCLILDTVCLGLNVRVCVCVWKSVLESLDGFVLCLSDQVDCLRKIAVISARWQASHLSPPDPPLAFLFAPYHCHQTLRLALHKRSGKAFLEAKWNTSLSGCGVCGLLGFFFFFSCSKTRTFPGCVFSTFPFSLSERMAFTGEGWLKLASYILQDCFHFVSLKY